MNELEIDKFAQPSQQWFDAFSQVFKASGCSKCHRQDYNWTIKKFGQEMLRINCSNFLVFI